MLDYYRFTTVSNLVKQGKCEEARLELAGLQRRYVALCDENTTFKMQIQEYEDILYLARNLIREGDFYWLTTGSIRQGPFCPRCYEREGVLMRLSGIPGERFCACCREMFPLPVPPTEKTEPGGMGCTINGEEFVPQVEKTPRKAKIIPFVK